MRSGIGYETTLFPAAADRFPPDAGRKAVMGERTPGGSFIEK
jgi:hypothetical protein